MHQAGQLLPLLRGIDISKRQLMRLLIASQDGFVDEARDVLRAGLETARWISLDDTGARHPSPTEAADMTLFRSRPGCEA
ncbi:hypothetical protein C8P66_13038 [Humitalea rosea]|uniref:Uncharacterized protein n=1 Tax=Humitalea rosea TaxID=990373 RepID=A0A2W7IL88_9PROT|nr:hypothetical protein [Humitalea rosea]PZW39303.1 hypothetical protein C8P66_13038 [Humitalea rosea]